MLGLVQYDPLLLTSLIEFAADNYGRIPVVSHGPDGPFRYDYRSAEQRARRLASSLCRRGVGEGAFVGSLAWSTHRHFELFYAVPGLGAVLHTANPRLAPDQLAFTINEAGERLLFVDPDCLPLVEAMLPRLEHVDTIVVMSGDLPRADLGAAAVLPYEQLIGEGEQDFHWPQFDERRGSTLCFTSGTSGDPKGVLYSHRGSYLSTLSIASPNYWDIGSSDAVLAIAPFFHCNGWAAPYLAPMTGAKLVFPGRTVDAPRIHQMIVEEGITVATGVPTIWLDVVNHCVREGKGLGDLNRIVSGGSAPPAALMRTLAEKFGVRTLQVWGMTETTHAATMKSAGADADTEAWRRAPQGRPTFGTRLRIIDDLGRALPRDGSTRGQLQVRGNWCAAQYLHRPDLPVCDAEGWLNTGDVAVLTDDGQLRITDRLKDVIKSGGEWISSIDLENAAIGHAGVLEAAVIGVPHPRWLERPVMIVVPKTGQALTEADLRGYLADRLPKWWLPDAIVMVDELPHSSTGKIHKAALRERYRDLLVSAAS